jgi:two-component system chemotaxis sensor kinase CheA
MDRSSNREVKIKLEEELSRLGSKLMAASGESSDGVLKLAVLFHVWSQVASDACGPWSKENYILSQMIVNGLESGRPAKAALDRLSQAMTEASQNLEMEIAGIVMTPGMDPANSSDTPATEGTFLITPDALDGYKDFITEMPEHLQSIERNLLSLSQEGQGDGLAVYRAFHTIKGIAGFMGLNQLSALSHKAEALLEPFKQGHVQLNEKQLDWLLRVCDQVRDQVQAIQQGMPKGKFELSGFEGLMSGGDDPAASRQPVREESANPETASSTDSKISENRVSDASIRINVEKMDALLEAVGELAICQSQVTEGINTAGVLGHLASEGNRLAKISRLLQEIILSLRMVPVQPLFQRMSRLGRDLSKKTGKLLRIETEGGETELDKHLIEELVDPLVHLIRNAVDHGIEDSRTRVEKGKNAEAQITLRAGHQGGDFVLRLEDDGAGLNFDKITAKARQMGYLEAGAEPTREQMIEFLFRPGFSTAEQVTEYSGRGVGLDVVRRKIQSLRGTIALESEPGQGTLFKLRIPLTLALLEGVLVRVGRERFILPASQVQGFLALNQTEEHSVGSGAKWLHANQGRWPLIELKKTFGDRAAARGRGDSETTVVVQVEAEGQKACLIVDEVMGKHQVVLKELGENLRDLRGVLGGAILGDGRVGLVLDMESLMRPLVGPHSAN